MTCRGCQQKHAWGLGESRLRLSFLRKGILARRHVHGRLQCWLLLKLLQLLLASFLHVCPCVLDALLPEDSQPGLLSSIAFLKDA